MTGPLLGLLGAPASSFGKAAAGIGVASAGCFVLRQINFLRSPGFRYLVWLLAVGMVVGNILWIHHEIGYDSHAYWAAWQHGHEALYRHPPGQTNAYLYSPAFAEAIWPLTLLPWAVFLAFWLTVSSTLYLWLLWPLPLVWRIPALGFVLIEILYGNVWPLFGAVAVLGFTRAGLWAFPLLTKVTPAVGFVWFAARREWRPLVEATLVAAIVVAVSAAVHPGLWLDWLRFLYRTQGPQDGSAPLALRLPLALALTVWAARKNRPEWLPLAMVAASPVFGLNGFALLAAVPRLRRRRPGLAPAWQFGRQRPATVQPETHAPTPEAAA